jgi:hypothetical protein
MRQIVLRLARALGSLADVMQVNWANLVAWWHDDVMYESIEGHGRPPRPDVVGHRVRGPRSRVARALA